MDMQGETLEGLERSTTRQVVDDYIAARIALDYREIAKLLHPDARFVMPANTGHSLFSGECCGRELICELFRQSDALLEFYDAQILDVLIDGNKAAVRWFTMQRNRGAGDPLPVSGCAFITQVGGLITEYVHYVDTATINELARR